MRTKIVSENFKMRYYLGHVSTGDGGHGENIAYGVSETVSGCLDWI